MPEPATAKRIREVMAGVFRTTIDDLPPEPAQGRVTGWDSLGHLRLILAVEAALKVKFRTTRIPHLTSLAALVQEVTDHGR